MSVVCVVGMLDVSVVVLVCYIVALRVFVVIAVCFVVLCCFGCFDGLLVCWFAVVLLYWCDVLLC